MDKGMLRMIISDYEDILKIVSSRLNVLKMLAEEGSSEYTITPNYAKPLNVSIKQEMPANNIAKEIEERRKEIMAQADEIRRKAMEQANAAMAGANAGGMGMGGMGMGGMGMGGMGMGGMGMGGMGVGAAAAMGSMGGLNSILKDFQKDESKPVEVAQADEVKEE